jgi:hypothetical protein
MGSKSVARSGAALLTLAAAMAWSLAAGAADQGSNATNKGSTDGDKTQSGDGGRHDNVAGFIRRTSNPGGG